MAVAIRLKRFGTNKDICFRVVVCDERVPRDGKVIEEIGYYDPCPDPPAIKIKIDRFDYWKGVGAKVSDTVRSLVKKTSKLTLETSNQKPPPSPKTSLPLAKKADPPQAEVTR